MTCPELDVLQARRWTPDLTAHVGACGSCRLVMELIDERSQAAESRDQRGECARFEALIAVRVGAELQGAAAAMLDEHVRDCADCRALANTMAPVDNAASDHPTLPAIDHTAYALGSEVARGGMGRILAARDLRIGRPVAVKELLAKSATLAARFEREARVTARLQHPGIVPIYEIGTWDNGTPFYAMRMVAGKTLRAALADRSTLEARLALLPSVLAAAEAVAFAHAHQVIHRDLTPSNILVGEYGETVVIDWGLAKDLSSETSDELDAGPYRRDPSASADLTAAGAVIGTASYMPPEQASGERVDARADVYALGAILYHLLAGLAPYKGSLDDVLRAVKSEPPAPLPPATPRDLASIVAKAMARDPGERYASAKELAAELTAFQAGRLVGAHEYTRGELIRRWVRKRRGVLAMAALALVALGLFGIVALRQIVDERDVAETARTAAEVSRVVSEQERGRADQLAVGLLEDRGRRELIDGNRERAVVYLSAAYSHGVDSPALRFMLADAMTAFDGEISRIDVTSASSASFDTTAFDHRGRRIVLVGEGKAAEIFDVASGAHVVALEGSDRGASNLEFSPDDASLFGSRNDMLMRWDTETGKLTASVVAHRGAMKITRLYDGGRLIATAGHEDGAIKIWDARSLMLVAEQPPLRHGISELVISPDDRHLLVVGYDSTATIRDARTARILRELHGNTGRLIAAQTEHLFSPDGKRLVLGDVGGTVTFWDVETGISLRSIPGHGVPVMAQFDPAGKRVLVVDFRRDVYIADAATGQTLTRFHGTGIAMLARFSGDGARVIAARLTSPTTGSMDVLDAASGALLARREGRPLMWNDSGDLVAVASSDQVLIATPSSGRLAKELSQPALNGGWFMIDNRHLMTQTADERRWIWDPDPTKSAPHALAIPLIDTLADGSRQLVRTSRGAELQDESGTVVAKLDDVDGDRALFTPDDRMVVVADAEGTVRVHDPTTGAKVATIAGHQAKLLALGCSRTGRCATVDTSGQVRAWTVDGVNLASCRPGDGRAGFVSISRDGTRMVVAVATAAVVDATAARWQAVLYAVDGCREIAAIGPTGKDRELKVDFRGPNVLVDHTVSDANDGHHLADIPAAAGELKVVLAPDGRHVAVVSFVSSPSLWSVARDHTPMQVVLDGSSDFDGRFSMDGTLFYAASVDGAVDVGDVTTGRVLARFPVPVPPLHLTEGQNDIKSQTFLLDVSEAGDQLMTVGPDQRARLWSVASEIRSADEIARLVAERSPWRLEQGRLVRSDLTGGNHALP